MEGATDIDSPARPRRVPVAALLASGTITSRFLGVGRVALTAFAIGNVSSPGADAYQTAVILPNTIYALVGGGLLTAVLVPHLVRASEGPDGGQAYANKIVSLAAVAFVVIAAAATLAAPALVRLYGVPAPDAGLATALALWSLPQLLFLGLYAVLGEVLTARRVFGPTTWAPVVNNLIAIASLGAFIAVFGASPHRSASSWTSGMVALLAGGATLGIVAQAAVMVVAWRRAGLRFSPDLRLRGAGLGGAGAAAFWSLGMLASLQLATWVETIIANSASGHGAATSALGTAWLILMLPQSVVTISLLTASYPAMSRLAAQGDLAGFRRAVQGPLRAVTGLLVLASAAMVAGAAPLGRLFTHNAADAGSLAAVIVAYAVGLVPMGAGTVLQRAFYALGDTRTPFFVTVGQMIVIIPGTLACVVLPQDWRAAGIAGVVSAGTVLQLVAVAVLLRRRIGALFAPLGSMVRFLIAGGAALAADLCLAALLGAFTPGGFALTGPLPALATLFCLGVTGAATYGGSLAALRGGELRLLATAVTERPRSVEEDGSAA